MQSSLLKGKRFLGDAAQLGRGNGTQTQALLGKTGTKQLKKSASSKPAQKASKSISKFVSQNKPRGTNKKVPVAPGASGRTRRGGGSRGGNFQADELWLPNTERPDWLDGTLPGDRGFDPLGLAKPGDFLQVDLDQQDQNKAVNKAGDVLGNFAGSAQPGGVSDNALAPYDEVFGLGRFRENELIHGRWAMLATLGVIISEAGTGISWADAGKVQLDSGTQYLGFHLPFSITQLTVIETLLVGGAEVYRNRELDTQKRVYPGGPFDPLGLTTGDDERTFKLRTAEIKHGRLAMIAFLGFSVQALTQKEGALGSLAKFASSFAPELVEEVEALAS